LPVVAVEPTVAVVLVDTGLRSELLVVGLLLNHH
jgi:hypothetical protein